jgi:hypothetical protein
MHSKVANFSVPPTRDNPMGQQDDDENINDQPHTPHNDKIKLLPN